MARAAAKPIGGPVPDAGGHPEGNEQASESPPLLAGQIAAAEANTAMNF
jgi:hypothetical protein